MFYCVKVLDLPSSRFQYNSTHYMYKFSLTNIVCPSQSYGTGTDGYHAKFRVDVPFSGSPDIRMSATQSFRFTNLLHRVTSKVTANPLYDSNGISIQNGGEVQTNNYLVGCTSPLSFVFDIPNITEANSWETIQVVFLQPLNSVKLDTSSCKLTSNTAVMWAMGNYSSNGQPATIQCSYSTLNNVLTFTNPNYTVFNYKYNQFFNTY